MKCKRGCNVPDRDGNEVRYEVGDTVDLSAHSKKTINAMVRAGCIDQPDNEEG